jgi:hypothetical protein
MPRITGYKILAADWNKVEEPPIAICTTSTAQSFTSGVLAIVQYNTAGYDPFGAITTGAAWKYTVAIAGCYQVNAGILWAQTTAWAPGEPTYLYLYKNGVGNYALDYRDDESTANHYVRLSGSALIQCSIGDALDIRALQTTGGVLGLHTDATYNYFSIVRVGA